MHIHTYKSIIPMHIYIYVYITRAYRFLWYLLMHINTYISVIYYINLFIYLCVYITGVYRLLWYMRMHIHTYISIILIYTSICIHPTCAQVTVIYATPTSPRVCKFWDRPDICGIKSVAVCCSVLQSVELQCVALCCCGRVPQIRLEDYLDYFRLYQTLCIEYSPDDACVRVYASD